MNKQPAQSSTQQYQIKPKQKEKFRPNQAKEIIKQVINDKFQNISYSEPSQLTFEIADSIKYKLKDMGLPRYQYMVNVVIGQQKGQGVRVGTRCFWDFDTDNCASEYFVNDTYFCLATVYGVYLY